MNQATTAWAAFKNMMRAAARDPIWTIAQIIIAPFNAGKYLLQVGALLVILIVVLGFGLRFVLERAGFPPGSSVSLIGDLVATLIILVVLFRLLTNPMIQHFGEMDGEDRKSVV